MKLMTESAFILVGGLSEVQRAVRDRFQDGGSITTAVLVLVALGLIIYAVFHFSMRQRRALQTTTPFNPQRLFSDLANGLGLTLPQRRFLDSVTRDLQLEQPAVVLLCPGLFDRHVNLWRHHRKSRPGAEEPTPDDHVNALRSVLFPTPSASAHKKLP